MDNQQQQKQTALNVEQAIASEELPGADLSSGTNLPDDLLLKLVGTPDGQSTTSESEPEPSGTEDQPSLNNLAEAAGGSDKLFQLTVALGDEEGTATIEQLKDDALAYRRGTRQQEGFEQERTSFANEKLRHMQQLQYAVTALGTDVSEEQLQPLRQMVERNQQVEDQILTTAVPGYEQDRPELSAFLSSEYGAPTEALSQPAPAWVRKALHDWWSMTQRIKTVAEQRKPSKAAKTTRNPDTARSDTVHKARVSAGSDPIGAAVDVLFKR